MRARRRARVGTKRLVIVRPPWRPLPGDRWIDVDTVEEAAAAIPAEAQRVFLTVGVRSLAPFAGRPDLWFLVRLVDEPAEPIPLARHQLICARGPFTEADERALLEAHGIDCLVTRASGGDATVAKARGGAGARVAGGDGAPPAAAARPVRVLDRGRPRLDRAASGSIARGASGLHLTARAQHVVMRRVVEVALVEVGRVERPADEDQRRSRQPQGLHLVPDGRRGCRARSARRASSRGRRRRWGNPPRGAGSACASPSRGC